MRILLFYHSGSYNRGCEAIIRTCAAEIKSKFPSAIIDLASYHPETDNVLKPFVHQIFSQKPIEIKKFSLEWFWASVYFKIFKKETFAQKLAFKNIISKIKNYDVFVSVGGDNYCYGETPDIYTLDHEIKKAGKKLVLWGASVGNEDLTPNKIKDLKSFDLILARESLTEQILKNAGCQNVKRVADGAFLMEKTELPLPEKFLENKTIGFNYSPLVFNKNNQSKEAAFQLIHHILQTTDFNIALVPHVIQKDNNDFETLKEFLEKFKSSNRVFLLPDNLNATEYKGYIARLKFFIGARTHATIAAYSSLIPTMVLGYSVKSKGIAKDIFGEEKLVLGIEEISDTDILIAKFDELKNDEEKIKEILKIKIPEIKWMAEKAKNELAEII